MWMFGLSWQLRIKELFSGRKLAKMTRKKILSLADKYLLSVSVIDLIPLHITSVNTILRNMK